MEIIDKSNMRKAILEFPEQFRVGLEAAKNIKASGTFKAILICGMGGSALPADILKMWLEGKKINLPLKIHRNYGLPDFIDKKYLVIFISYSGNTEETLDAFKAALRRKLRITAISSGGKLNQLCKDSHSPIAIIPSGFQPRLAVGFQFAALMKILANCRLIKDNVKDISNLENLLEPDALENQGKELARNLKDMIPLIYASERLCDLARIWKIKFNENSKVPAFSSCFPELNHNEHNQFEGNKNNQLSVIILRDEADHPRILKRMELFAEMLKQRKIAVNSIDIAGKKMLYKIFNNILLSDWVSYYLALEYKTDPMPVKFNDEFKKRMAQ